MALRATHDCGTEPALSWLVENAGKLEQESETFQQSSDAASMPSVAPPQGKILGRSGFSGMPCKQASQHIVMRSP